MSEDGQYMFLDVAEISLAEAKTHVHLFNIRSQQRMTLPGRALQQCPLAFL